ncbi:hypothetical protein QR97_08600 [Streptomyces sp. PBH53]|nr:hypothetical protein QR97_08600 [Streptomyces sp. PBH53]
MIREMPTASATPAAVSPSSASRSADVTRSSVGPLNPFGRAAGDGARRTARARSTSSCPLASPTAAWNSAYRTRRSLNVANVNGFRTYWTTPSETPSRTTARSRADVTAITSAWCPAARRERANCRPCTSGRWRSSRSRSTGVRSRMRRASAPVCAFPTATNPGTRSTYITCASAATGSSSTTRTRRGCCSLVICRHPWTCRHPRTCSHP